MFAPTSRPTSWRRPGVSAAAAVAAVSGIVLSGLVPSGVAGAVGPTLPAKSQTPATTKPAAGATPKTTVKSSTKTVSKSSKTASKSSAAKKSTSKASLSGLGVGSRGAAVQAVQERLIALKYDITEAEGQFGDQTFHAVMAFQKTNGLSRTGRVGTQMLQALETATDPEPMMPTGGANRVEVDLKRQMLTIWENNELYKIVSISSGNNKDFCSFDPETNETSCDKAVTPTGSYRIQRRWVGWRESRLGEMYNPLYFTGGFAIHGSLSVPGTPASHGCVRVPMVSAEWLPGILEDGTPVYVFGALDTDKKPTPLKTSSSSTSRPVSGASTIPGASTVPGQTAPPTTVSTTSTSTTTTLVRLLDGSGPPTPATTPPATTAPPSSLLPVG